MGLTPHLQTVRLHMGRLKFRHGRLVRGKKCVWNRTKARMKDKLILMGFKRIHSEMRHQFWALRTRGKTRWAKRHGGKLWDPKSPGHRKFRGDYTMIDKVSKRHGRLTAIYHDACGMFVGYAASTVVHNKAWTRRLRKAAFKYAYNFLIDRVSAELRKRVTKKV